MLWRRLYTGIPKLKRVTGYFDDIGSQIQDEVWGQTFGIVRDKGKAIGREAVTGAHVGTGPECDGCGEAMVDAWSGDSVGWWSSASDPMAMSAVAVPLVPMAGAEAWGAAPLDAFDPALHSSGLEALDAFDADALDLGGIDEVVGELMEGVAGFFEFLGAL
jgi:hypothetical protein